MRGHRALAPAGCARGEQDVADVVRSDGRGAVVGCRHRDLSCPADELLPADPGSGARGPLIRFDRDPDDEAGQPASGSPGRLREQHMPVGAEERASDQQRPDVAPADHIQCLRPREAGIHRHERGASIQCAQPGDRPVVRVRRPERHPVARLDPAGDQRPGSVADPLVQVAEAQNGTAWLGHRGRIAEPPRGRLHRRRDSGLHRVPPEPRFRRSGVPAFRRTAVKQVLGRELSGAVAVR